MFIDFEAATAICGRALQVLSSNEKRKGGVGKEGVIAKLARKR